MVLLTSCITLIQAQDQIVLHISDSPESMRLCYESNQQVVVYAQENCEQFYWRINNVNHFENPIVINPQRGINFHVEYLGCEFGHDFWIRYIDSNVPNDFTHTVWKRQAEMDTIAAVGHDSIDYPFMYEFLWSTGETTRTIEVTEPGTYTCTISELCGTATRTFIVRDNVEIALATCDLETNHNLVTWPVSTAQAEYISQVEVKRDGLVVGTAPYTDGQFVDNIGSDAASRTYTVTAIATDGTPCPITSYPKETIHMAYLTGMNNTIEVNWNTPTGYDLMGYNICEWNANDGTLTTIDYVGASVTSYTCQESVFDQGYIVVQGVEAGKDAETRLLSNRSQETVGIGENTTENGFKVYPNPVNGVLFVETYHGASLPAETEYHIVNPIGQTLLQGAITSEKQQIDVRSLPKGVYFIIVGGVTQKFVVE